MCVAQQRITAVEGGTAIDPIALPSENAGLGSWQPAARVGAAGWRQRQWAVHLSGLRVMQPIDISADAHCINTTTLGRDRSSPACTDRPCTI